MITRIQGVKGEGVFQRLDALAVCFSGRHLAVRQSRTHHLHCLRPFAKPQVQV